MIQWYARDGSEITMEQANVLMGDMEYKRVLATQIGQYWVSTVWLGLDHAFHSEGPPIIFETMVFAPGDIDVAETLGPDIWMNRYATEEAALAGHEEICTLIRATIQEEVPDGMDRHPGESG